MVKGNSGTQKMLLYGVSTMKYCTPFPCDFTHTHVHAGLITFTKYARRNPTGVRNHHVNIMRYMYDLCASSYCPVG